MQVRNLTPFAFGTKVCSRKPPQPEMTLVVRGTFVLAPNVPLEAIDDLVDQGFMSSERYLDDDPEGACIYPGDFADFKLSAEVMLKGSCHPPGGKASECAVSFRVGEWSKSLRVVGDRRWSGAVVKTATKPEPFTSMPLGWDRAFGGPGFADNPAGRGASDDRLPNLEAPGAPIQSPSDKPAPACFGPISPQWPARIGKRGKAYGGDYQKTRAPWYAADFDWSYFNVAPPDQRLKGYLRGDEKIAFHNLHPDAPVLESELPGLRLRAFVEDDRGSFREIDMRLDTLWADLDEGRVQLTWRGVEAVREDDLDDVAYLLIASEPLAERKKDEAHYRAEMDAFKTPPVGPPVDAELLELAERMEADVELDEQTHGNPLSALLAARLGDVEADKQKQIAEAMESAYAAAPDKKEEIDARIREIAQTPIDSAPVAIPRKPGVLPDSRLRPAMRKLLEGAAEMRKGVEHERIPDADRKRILAKADELEQVPHDPRFKLMDPEYEPPLEPLSDDEPGPGANLAEREFARADWSGMDLSGANLYGAVLTKVNLSGANLSGANLKRAILYQANLSGANLAGADLTQANLADSVAHGACFDRANLDLASFEGADVSSASFVASTGEYQAMARANLNGAQGRGASFALADFSEADLEGASMVGADLRSCIFSGCRAKSVDLRDATIAGSTFEGAELPFAKLTGTKAERSVWLRAVIDDADLSFAVLCEAQLTKTSAARANFFGADLKDARTSRARLQSARLDQANLFGADLRKAKLDKTRFVGANLYGANLVGASGKGADFTDAVLTRALLEAP